MPSIDDRIVRMEFDNAAFEKKIQATLDSLKQLEKALKFDGAQNGLAGITAAADRVNFHTISQGIEGVSKGFIAMSTIAITALSNITNKAIQAGTQIAKSLTVDPILDGLREYETNMTSIQTILSNTSTKGTTLDDVTAALDKLNEYSDKTIYNFGQMARNIGTFTAAGVDLQVSVDAIKGIANLAALSGSSAEQASSAMYQLSQAIATGTLRLIDWNSVNAAGIGGEVFQNALFETGKALGTLTNVPVGQTFKQWKDAGNSFRDSLQDGWITAEVLTTTLAGFTGDLTEEMLIAKGYTQEQATNIMKIAEIAKNAATEVKTFSQLVATVKESIGTSWADTFRIVIGNFTEAKALWTSVNNSISDFVQRTADARNEILQSWKDMGGRTLLIESLKQAFSSLWQIIQPIKDAFSDIFPPVTAERLYELTSALSRFATAMIPTQDTVNTIRSTFRGFFAVLAIGWEILKEGVGFVVNLGKTIIKYFGGDVSKGFTAWGDAMTALKNTLVDGGRIHAFFEKLGEVIDKPVKLLHGFFNVLKDVFNILFGIGQGSADVAGSAIDRLTERFNMLFEGVKTGIQETLGRIWEPLSRVFETLTQALDKIWQGIREWFSTLGDKMAKALKSEDFNAVLDVINTVLLGGIVALIANFLKKGFNFNGKVNFDIGSGLLARVGMAIGELTKYLQALTAKVKADALVRIATAIAILTASVLVLSLIDSGSLGRALAAMSVGFGQLIASFTLLTKMMVNPKMAASFTAVTAGLILLSFAMFGLAISVSMLSSLSWEELGRGLTGVIGILVGLVAAVRPLAASSKGMIVAGIGIQALAVGMVILAAAMKIFATMSWEELGKGLTGVAGGLGIVIAAMHLMPNPIKMALIGFGLIGVAISMNILAAAMKIFGTFGWEELGKGLAGVGGGLGLIAAAMNLMPATAPLIAAGVLITAVSMNILAAAMKIFATMSWDEIARGLVAMGGALAILAAGLYVIGQSGGGALALVVAAVGLGVLGAVVERFSKLSWSEIGQGLGAMAAALAAVALAGVALGPAVPAMLALGAALLLLGAGFALMGVGLYSIGQGLQQFTKLSQETIKNLGKILAEIAKSIPVFLKGLAEGLIQMLMVFVDATPVLLKALGKIVDMLLTVLIDNLPKLKILISDLIEDILDLIVKHGPRLIKVGIFMIVQLLEGIERKIGKITETVADILIEFLKAFEEKIPEVGRQLADTIIEMWLTAAYEVGRIAGTLLVGIGKAFMQGLRDGVDSQTNGLMGWFMSLPGKIVGWIGETISKLWQKGVDFMTGLLNGLLDGANAVNSFFINLPGNILGFFLGAGEWLLETGKSIIQGLLNGIREIFENVKNWFGDIVHRIKNNLPPNPIEWLLEVGKKVIEGLLDGMKWGWEKAKGWLSSLNPANWFNDINLKKGHAEENLVDTGRVVMGGLQSGMETGWVGVTSWLSTLDPSQHMEVSWNRGLVKILSETKDKMQEISEFAPTITPVLDMSRLKEDAKSIGSYIDIPALSPTFSHEQAKAISKAASITATGETVTEPVAPDGIRFEQNIYAPKQLSTSDIYKNTRNQIRIAKEELKIP